MSDDFYSEWRTRQRIANEWQNTVLQLGWLIVIAAVILVWTTT